QTFGKGSVQTIIPLRDQAGLRLTTAKYYTPLGRQIHGMGITPDIVVEQKAPDLEALKGKPSEKEKIQAKMNGNGHGDAKDAKDAKPEEKQTAPDSTDTKAPEAETDSSVVDLEKDYQLQRAIGVLKSWDLINKIQDKTVSASLGKKK
ncbi:MAG: S41 family peptidase, partial [Nitrospinota bacterium]|nr:S41 family peptidase [Nitrospinota bacterium]